MSDIEITETFTLLSIEDYRDRKANQLVDRRLDNARVLRQMNSEPMIDEIYRRIGEAEEAIISINGNLSALLDHLIKTRAIKNPRQNK